MKPYFESDEVTIYHGDCREILPTLRDPELLLTDPPYGVNEGTDRFARGRSGAADCNDFAPIEGDDEPFDPAHLLNYSRLVLFGANYYADKLPPSPTWIVWDKLDGLTSERDVGFNDNADVELAWTNLGGPARLIPHRWMGMLKGSEKDDKRQHPTQKPVVLFEFIISMWTKPGDLITDPYMGSGTTLVAARLLGRPSIGIEIDERYCEVASNRLAQGVFQL